MQNSLQFDSFVKRLDQLIEAKGYTYRSLSLEIGYNEAYIQHIIRGQHSLTMDSFFAICEVLGVTPQQFFNFDDSSVDYADLIDILGKMKPGTRKVAKEILADLLKHVKN